LVVALLVLPQWDFFGTRCGVGSGCLSRFLCRRASVSSWGHGFGCCIACGAVLGASPVFGAGVGCGQCAFLASGRESGWGAYRGLVVGSVHVPGLDGTLGLPQGAVEGVFEGSADGAAWF
jgi:hypothetical protein